MCASALLEVEGLNLAITRDLIHLPLIHDISFKIFPGEIVGLVGESGSGKSLTASAILGLLPPHCEAKGKLLFEGRNLFEPGNDHPRGRRLSLIMQDPALALNPLMPIGKQLVEGLLYHQKMPQKQAWNKGIEWLDRVGVRNPSERMKQYPHEFSGGMKQRILIAMALICKPSLLIADEPTTALDVTIQAQILQLLLDLQREERMSLLLITHDLGVVAYACQRVMVMYAGQIVESGPVERIFQQPAHPYTQGLIQSRQSLTRSCKEPLYSLEGHLQAIHTQNKGCSFAPRCPAAMKICLERQPPCEEHLTHSVHCWLTKHPGGK